MGQSIRLPSTKIHLTVRNAALKVTSCSSDTPQAALSNACKQAGGSKSSCMTFCSWVAQPGGMTMLGGSVGLYATEKVTESWVGLGGTRRSNMVVKNEGVCWGVERGELKYRD